jgi:hypothetical protein
LNRFALLYVSLCLFYTAVFVWLEAPAVGILEANDNFDGIIGGPIAWLLLGVGLPYALLVAPLNARVLRQASQKGASDFRLAVLAAAWVIAPGSIGIGFYLLTGNPYVALPFDALMLLLTPYYYWHLSRLLSRPTSPEASNP